jgi:hypothetical protein
MGYFRFRRSIKILPGIRWNIGKKGSSISLGGHGLTHTISAKGSRTTIGIPGTGISYTQVHGSTAQPSSPPPLPTVSPSQAQKPRSSRSTVFYVLGLILLGIWLLGKVSQLSKSTSAPAPKSASNTDLWFALPTPFSQTNRTPQPRTLVPRQLAQTPASLSSTPASSPPEVRRAEMVQTPGPAVPDAASGLSAFSQSLLPAPTPKPQTYRVVNVPPSDFLYLRSGPGMNYPLVAKILPATTGITLEGIRATNGPTRWQRVRIGRVFGWVSEIYLEVE